MIQINLLLKYVFTFENLYFVDSTQRYEIQIPIAFNYRYQSEILNIASEILRTVIEHRDILIFIFILRDFSSDSV